MRIICLVDRILVSGELEVARCQMRGHYAVQCDCIVGVIGDDRVCSDLLGIGHRSRVVRKQRMVELQHVTRRIEVGDGVVAETRIEAEDVVAVSDRPDVTRRRHQLVLPVSDGDCVVGTAEHRVVAVAQRDRAIVSGTYRVVAIAERNFAARTESGREIRAGNTDRWIDAVGQHTDIARCIGSGRRKDIDAFLKGSCGKAPGATGIGMSLAERALRVVDSYRVICLGCTGQGD